jgi:uncharacterized protein (TIGR03067 family)
MKLCHLIVAVSLLPLAAAPQEKGPANGAPLQGAWNLHSLQIDMHPGNVITLQADELGLDCHLLIMKDRCIADLGKGELELDYQLHPDAKPPAIDLILTAGHDKGRIFRGIYKLDGDTLTICRPSAVQKQRPMTFAVKQGSGLMLTVWKRKKS